MLTLSDTGELLKIAAAVAAIVGGSIGLIKFLADRREKEVREWQKVVLYKILRQDELSPLTFSTLLEKYRVEAQAFSDVDLKKREISEDALRRVLLELVSSNVVSLEPSGSFRLKITLAKIDQFEMQNRLNDELAKLVGANPHVYTLDDVAKEIAPKLGLHISIVRNTLRVSIEQLGTLEIDSNGHLAFPR